MVKKRPILFAVLLTLLCFFVSIALGAIFIHPETTAKILLGGLVDVPFPKDWPNAFEVILLSIRVPHTILVLMTGAALACSGAAYQGLFRNPLSDPYLIGVASGAGLGAVIMMSIRWPENLLGFFLIPSGAFIGAICTVLLVYQLARVNGIVPLTTLILAGVAIGSLASAITSFIMLQDDGQVHRAISFMLGGSPIAGWGPVIASIPFMVLGMVALTLSGHTLNVLQFGEEEARQMGLNVDRAKIIVIIIASLTTAAAVSFSGVIGFVGLIVPHVVRIIWGPDYRKLILISIFLGGSTLLVADMLARTIMAPATIPVGIITAIIGSPFFLWILRQAKKEVFW